MWCVLTRRVAARAHPIVRRCRHLCCATTTASSPPTHTNAAPDPPTQTATIRHTTNHNKLRYSSPIDARARVCFYRVITSTAGPTDRRSLTLTTRSKPTTTKQNHRPSGPIHLVNERTDNNTAHGNPSTRVRLSIVESVSVRHRPPPHTKQTRQSNTKPRQKPRSIIQFHPPTDRQYSVMYAIARVLSRPMAEVVLTAATFSFIH